MPAAWKAKLEATDLLILVQPTLPEMVRLVASEVKEIFDDDNVES